MWMMSNVSRRSKPHKHFETKFAIFRIVLNVGLLKQTAVMHLVSHFFPVNMIFSAVQPLGYNKICIGFNPRGGARGPLSAPDYNWLGRECGKRSWAFHKCRQNELHGYCYTLLLPLSHCTFTWHTEICAQFWNNTDLSMCCPAFTTQHILLLEEIHTTEDHQTLAVTSKKRTIEAIEND